MWVCGNISLWFWLVFSRWLVILNTFSCTYCHLHVFFGKIINSVPLHIFNQIFYLVYYWLYEFFIYFGCWPFIRRMICKYLLPFCKVAFDFVNDFLCYAEAFQFDVIPFVYFHFYCFCSGCQIRKKFIGKTNVKGLMD